MLLGESFYSKTTLLRVSNLLGSGCNRTLCRKSHDEIIYDVVPTESLVCECIMVTQVCICLENGVKRNAPNC